MIFKLTTYVNPIYTHCGEINYLLNMKNLFLSIILLATASCASIVSDSQYPVSSNSSPSDAKFKITINME